MSQAYYRRWRPQGWDEIVGQEHVVRTVRNAVGQGNIAHAYLLSGPRGTGKTTTARIIAKAANCLAADQVSRPCNECANCEAVNKGRFLDLIEIDAASNTSVDDVRDLREKITFSPSVGRYKVYIIDEVHMLSNAAFNALLKTLEEPPAHAIFVLATTEIQKIPATVLSRCQRHEFRRIPLNLIQALLKEIANKEGIHVDPSAITAIARQATGSMRDAVSLLDQLASTGTDVSLELTQQVLGTATSLSIFELIDALLKEDIGSSLSIINRAINYGSDPRQYARQVVENLRAILMVKMGNQEQVETTTEESEKLNEFSKRYPLNILLDTIHVFDYASQHTNVGWQPGLQLELAASQVINNNLHLRNESESKDKKINPVKAELGTIQQFKNSTDHLSRKATQTQQIENQNSPAQEKLKKVEKPEIIKQSGEESSTSDFKKSWIEIRAAAKTISSETAALLNSCKSSEVKNGRLVLGFSSALLRDKMETGQNLENTRLAIKQITGTEMRIVCRVAGKEENTVPEGLNIDQDGLVGAALRLGGKISNEEKQK